MADHTAPGDASDSSSAKSPPPPPNPAADPRLSYLPSPESEITSPRLVAQVDDIFKVSPAAALKLLAAGIEFLAESTGDIPPHPPTPRPPIHHMRGMEAEKKNIVRSNSEKSLARLLQQASSKSSRACSPSSTPSTATSQKEPVDGVQLRTPNPTPPPNTESQPRPPLEPYIIVGENAQPLNAQHSAMVRRFYSKATPPIPITDYLLRIHRFLPMSTAVCLAASLYIHRLAVVEQAIVVTRRNSHRLLLAALRIAMKAIEDATYSLTRFARVGGVSNDEMQRLEISFCFLTSFELMVTEESLGHHWEILRRGRESWEPQEVEGEGDVTIFGDPPRRTSPIVSAAG